MALPFIFQACGVKQPTVDRNLSSAGYSHSGNETNCSMCHEGQRPSSTLSFSNLNFNSLPFDYTTHGAGFDCYECHANNTMGFRAPAEWANGRYKHPASLTKCATCHTPQRPVNSVGPNTYTAVAFVHSVSGLGDCAGCHQATMATQFASLADWQGGAGAPAILKFDVRNSISVNEQIPTYSATSISILTPQTQVIPMNMSHASAQIPQSVINNCVLCHVSAYATPPSYYPGVFHAAIGTQPSTCVDCHRVVDMPVGFVGTTNVGRNPAGPEMKHDAVVWSKNLSGSYAATSSALVTNDCNVCHQVPTNTSLGEASWRVPTTAISGGSVFYHASLAAKGLSQPTSCLDCHANSMIAGPQPAVALNTTVMRFDHSWSVLGSGDCVTCHTAPTTLAQTSSLLATPWVGGVFHQPAIDATLTRCDSCHDVAGRSQRPTGTSLTTPNGVVNNFTAYNAAVAPFDTSTHGAPLDCIVCHAATVTKSSVANWAGGNFYHLAANTAGTLTSCVGCHESERPLLTVGPNALIGSAFSHLTSGQGDCVACHRATVVGGTVNDGLGPVLITGGKFAKYNTTNTTTWGDTDWYGGVTYNPTGLMGPNPDPNTPPTTISAIQLSSNTANLSQITTSINTQTLIGQMRHTSIQVPAVFFTGANLTTASPDGSCAGAYCCSTCHTNLKAAVPAFVPGIFHATLTANSLTAPTACQDCHVNTTPKDIVGAAPLLAPMDHAAALSGGGSAAASFDCFACHSASPQGPPNTFGGGTFHANLSGQNPNNCTTCHFTSLPTGLFAPVPNYSLASAYVTGMRHTSTFVAGDCAACHALSNISTLPVVTSSWTGGLFHKNTLPNGLTSCSDCHTTKPSGYAQSLNDTQHMNHSSTNVGNDCAICHQAELVIGATPNSWSRSALFHTAVPTPASCRECHGLSNGGGAVVGTNNDLPGVANYGATLINSGTLTTSPVAVAGTYDKIDHTEIDVAGRDCNYCHTTAGMAANAGVKWKSASFHVQFSSNTQITGRCDSCHIGLKPTVVVNGEDHSQLGTTDCNSCHNYPGTGIVGGSGSSAPNWLGATSLPTTLKTDLNKSVVLVVQIPTYNSTSISLLTPQPDVIAMNMNHSTTQVPRANLDDCIICHAGAFSKPANYTGGVFHNSLTAATLAQPTTCSECHATTDMPIGFIGPTDSTRTPAGPEMKHNAVVWQKNITSGVFAATATPMVANDCVVCHQVPTASPGSGNGWNIPPAAISAGAVAYYHASLGNSSVAQPASCLDCHANSRPVTPVTGTLSNFDHSATIAGMGDCNACHATPTSVAQVTALKPWSGGVFHSVAINATLTSCNSCHNSQRPTAATFTTSGGVTTAFTAYNAAVKPFDLASHGGALDCKVCHTPGTYTGAASWAGGAFDHLAANTAGTLTSCSNCHTTQRPAGTVGPNALINYAFNHTLNGSGDCIACHRASVVGGTVNDGNGNIIISAGGHFANYATANGAAWGDSDWYGGETYDSIALMGPNPALTPLSITALHLSSVSAPLSQISVTSNTQTFAGQMMHTSTAVPSVFFTGANLTTANSNGTCAGAYCCSTCHANLTNATPAYLPGVFHATITAHALPSVTKCKDCHINTAPKDIVGVGSPSLPLTIGLTTPMDHAALLSGGGTAYSSFDCYTCHAASTQGPPNTFSGGKFHASLGAQTPSNCTTCHFTTLPIGTFAPLPLYPAATTFVSGFKHSSAFVSGDCSSCHTLTNISSLPVATTSWAGGHFHKTNGPVGITSCTECHSSAPSSVTMSSNDSQHMDHTAVSALYDCAVCHTGDLVAGTTPTAWNKLTKFHTIAPNPATCQECHGLANGSLVAGNGNDIPGVLNYGSNVVSTDSITTSSVAPASTHDKIDHAVVDVGSQDCNFCHTVVGMTAGGGVKWMAAKFHAKFASNAQILERCDSCHTNLKPTVIVGGEDHSLIGTQDCAKCHMYPGTGAVGGAGATAPNWLGAVAVPTTPKFDATKSVPITVQVPTYVSTSITVVTPLAASIPMNMNHQTTQISTANMATCSTCHAGYVTDNYTGGVLHASLAAAGIAQPVTCAECHTFGNLPSGFMGAFGPTLTPRVPPSPEMIHNAVTWVANTAGTYVKSATSIVTTDCSSCHLVPTTPPASGNGWSKSIATLASTVTSYYHPSLSAKALAQPTSCLDCHANSRPSGAITGTLTAFNHASNAAGLGDCNTCHTTPTTVAQVTAAKPWAGGVFHKTAVNATLTTCTGCHGTQRPTNTTFVASSGTITNFTAYSSTTVPFDLATHGSPLDCNACHTPTTYTTAANWAGGNFNHLAANTAGTLTTCVNCHSTQRPAVTVGPNTLIGYAFNHTNNGAGDCVACHRATVIGGVVNDGLVNFTITGGKFTKYNTANTATWGDTDWYGGETYNPTSLMGPSSTATPLNITATHISSNTAPIGQVTTSTSSQKLIGQMMHTSAQVPGVFFTGSNLTTTLSNGTCSGAYCCSTCHANLTAATPTYQPGLFHTTITGHSLTAPTQCKDCHVNTTPKDIIGTSILTGPMDHWATLSGGGTAYSTFDCYTCHAASPQGSPNTFSGGVFHSAIGSTSGSQTPTNCMTCHFTTLPATIFTPVTGYAVGTPAYVTGFKHSSTFVAGDCAGCHVLSNAQIVAAAKTQVSWGNTPTGPGTATYHKNVAPANITACSDCHGTMPSTLTVSAAATDSQHMLHTSPTVGTDCAKCHKGDLVTGVTPTGWSQSTSFHTAVPTPTTCKECHSSDQPAGLFTTPTLTTSTVTPTLHDTIDHTQADVAAKDCVYCHANIGMTANGGTKWKLGTFHKQYSANSTLISTSTCATCHSNLKPGPNSLGIPDHSTGSYATSDCKSCHNLPGLGTTAAPNWLGATGAPTLITLNGWASGNGTTTGSSITSNNLTFAHPRATTYTSCNQCHVGTDYTKVMDYNHDGLTTSVQINGVTPTTAPNMGTTMYNIATNPMFCVTCHETGTPYVTTTGLSSTLAASTTSASTIVTVTSTATLVVGMTVSGTGIPNLTTVSFTGSTTTGSTSVTVSSTTGLSNGMTITGSGITAGTTIASVGAGTITLSAAATATATGVALTATKPLTVTVKTIPSPTYFTTSTAANATLASTTLTFTHKNASNYIRTIGNHNNSTRAQECTSCHYVGSGTALLTPPTPGVFNTGTIKGN